jgi:DNA replication and repair protein RecF
VTATVLSDAGDEKSLEYVFQISPRRSSAFFIQDVKTPLLEFIGMLPTITFLPQALTLFTGPPADRRGFLDSLTTQLRPAFAAERMEYERILKQRNALLKQVASGEAKESALEIWDEQLSGIGARIIGERKTLLAEINRQLPGNVQTLGEAWETVEIRYEPTAKGDDAAAMRSALMQCRSRDIILQSTTVGPHRDDWTCLADGRDISTFASRGQQRAALLGLLFVSAQLFGKARGEKPVILLDDVLSELDDAHQSALLTHLQDYQVLITATHPTEHVADLTAWEVGDGKISVL